MRDSGRCCLLALLLLDSAAAAAPVAFTSSNLPIVLIDTGEREIPDEPKVEAWMGIVDSGPGQKNRVNGTRNGYDGAIGIEVRGASSQDFPKKSYAVETRGASGGNLNVSLLGLPEENDWVLYAPYSDKSLMRNVISFWLAESTGRYASRTRFCELVLNGQYEGVYVLMEKIKRDNNRVDISSLDPDEVSGDELTGGYIFKLDKNAGSENGGWRSRHSSDGRFPRYSFHYPKPSEIAPAQAAYIQGFMDAFEDMMASPSYADPETGYPAYIDVASFIDHYILNETTKNVDGYRLSQFMYKDKDSRDGRLVMGPPWDFNLAFGNVDYDGRPGTVHGKRSLYLEGPSSTGLQLDNANFRKYCPFWWFRLLGDPAFASALNQRWYELRQGPLQTEAIIARIEETAAHLAEAQARNFGRWPILGVYVWPNYLVGETYAEEVEYLKQWTRERLLWLDAHIPSIPDEDQCIFADRSAPGLTPFPQANVVLETQSGRVYRGEAALALNTDGFWGVLWKADVGLDLLGYAYLHLALHPENLTGSSLDISLNGRIVHLLGNDAGAFRVDLAREEWQEVEIPLARFGLGPSEKLTLIRCYGHLEGQLFLDDIRLTPYALPSITAVQEDHRAAAPAAPILAQSFPNPCNGGTTIQYALDSPQEIDLAIHNMAGQRVRTLAQGFHRAAEHTAHFDGRDDAGRQLASGVFLCRLRTSTGVTTRKLLLLR